MNVAKYLHEHRTEGCSDWAMHTAAAMGYKDIVDWLHKEGIGRINGFTIAVCLRKNQTEIALWLYHNRSEPIDPRCLVLLKEDGVCVSLEDWLRQEARQPVKRFQL